MASMRTVTLICSYITYFTKTREAGPTLASFVDLWLAKDGEFTVRFHILHTFLDDRASRSEV